MLYLYKTRIDDYGALVVRKNAKPLVITPYKAAKVLFFTFGRAHRFRGYDEFPNICCLNLSEATEQELSDIEKYMKRVEKSVYKAMSLQGVVAHYDVDYQIQGVNYEEAP